MSISIPVWYDWGVATLEREAQFQEDFNSSMVRLGGIGFVEVEIQAVIFQFQYGTIGGTYRLEKGHQLIVFQFQYGTIGGSLLLWREWITPIFQFQYGTIGGMPAANKYKVAVAISIPVWYDWGTGP